jgi:hypothetical protein
LLSKRYHHLQILQKSRLETKLSNKRAVLYARVSTGDQHPEELNHLGIEFVSFRENIDTGGPLGRAMVVQPGTD